MSANQKANKSVNNRDDLQKIKGIAKKTVKVLNRLGIYRYSDLLKFSPDSLADHLKSELPFISAQRIEHEDWLGQAQKLAESQRESLQPQVDEPAVNLTNEHQEDMFNVSHKHWREVADFFVSFGFAIGQTGEERLQTRAHHSQFENSAQWEGIATKNLINWMLDQAKLSIPEETEAEAGASIHSLPDEAVAEEAAFLELSDLWVSEAQTAESAGGRRPSAALRAESRLNVSGPAAIRLTEDQLPFIIELYLVDTQTNQSKLTASYPGLLIPDQLSYDIKQDFPIPSTAGRYQLYLVARLLPPGAAVAHLQGPIIRVEA